MDFKTYQTALKTNVNCTVQPQIFYPHVNKTIKEFWMIKNDKNVLFSCVEHKGSYLEECISGFKSTQWKSIGGSVVQLPAFLEYLF